MNTTRIPSEDTGEKFAAPRAPLRVMQTMLALAEHPAGIGLRELSSLLDLPTTSLFSLLKSLEAGGYIISKDRRHKLGPQAFGLAAAIHRSEPFAAVARPLYAALSAAVEESVLFAVLSEDRASVNYTDLVETSHFFRYSPKLGSLRPLYATSLGHLFLAYFSDEECKRYVKSTALVKFGPGTITSRSALLDAIGQVRATGIATSRSGIDDGLSGIAAAIFDHAGTHVAAIAVAGPTSRMDPALQKIKVATIECARQISSLLGYNGIYPLILRS